MTDTVQDKIQESATGPKRVRGDSGEVEQHSLPDQIAADRYLLSKAATIGKRLGLRFMRLFPPGTVHVRHTRDFGIGRRDPPEPL